MFKGESRIQDKNYITIQAFMVKELNLKGNDLIIYATIFGFSQTLNQDFTGSLEYLAQWTQSSIQGVRSSLQKLIEAKLIEVAAKDSQGKNISYRATQWQDEDAQHSVARSEHSVARSVTLSGNNNINNISNKDKGASKGKLIDPKKANSKAQDMYTMRAMILDFTENEEVQGLLLDYLTVRRKRGLIPQQWKLILDDLREYAQDDGDLAIEMIKNATANSSGAIIMQWQKDKKNKVVKPNFDTAADNAAQKGVDLMSEEEKEKFMEDLARDEEGKLVEY